MNEATREQESETLWQDYQGTGSVEARNRLVLYYGWLVRAITRRVMAVSSGYVETDDLTSCGTIGLIKAIEKFDHTKGVTFETFATYRVRGEILDFVRRSDWVPRGVRKRVLEMKNAEDELATFLGRRPSDTELCERLGIEEKALSKTRACMERFNILSFEEMLYDAAGDVSGGDSPENTLQESEMLDMLAKAVEDLPERDRLVITLYYHEELTLKEISEVIGVTESRVSQIHSRAVGRIKKSMQTYIRT